MTSEEMSFERAQALVTAVLRAGGHGSSTLVPVERGRDLGGQWAIFLEIADGSLTAGAPVVLVDKYDGSIKLAQIPPRFDILEAPVVVHRRPLSKPMEPGSNEFWGNGVHDLKGEV